MSLHGDDYAKADPQEMLQLFKCRWHLCKDFEDRPWSAGLFLFATSIARQSRR